MTRTNNVNRASPKVPRKRPGSKPPVPQAGRRVVTSTVMGGRVHTFVRLLLRGAVRSELHTYARLHWLGEPGTSTRHIDTLIAKAKEVIRQDWDEQREQFTAELLGQLGQLAKEARAQKNLSTVLGCYNSMARIVGLGAAPPAG
jgi:hypothetical protein